MKELSLKKKKKSPCGIWKCFLKKLEHFVLILMFQLTGKKKNAKVEMKLLGLVACFHNYSQNTSMKYICFHKVLLMCGISIS